MLFLIFFKASSFISSTFDSEKFMILLGKMLSSALGYCSTMIKEFMSLALIFLFSRKGTKFSYFMP